MSSPVQQTPEKHVILPAMPSRPRREVDGELDVLQVIETLEALVADPALGASLSKDEHVRLMAAAGRLSRPSKIERLKASRSIRKEKHRRILRTDREAVWKSGIREARKCDVFSAPERRLQARDGG